MPAWLFAALLLAAPPGDASRLVPDPDVPLAPAPLSSEGASVPTPERSLPVVPAGAAVLVAGGAVVATASRRRPDGSAPPGPGTALGLRPPDDVVVVFVPGHGSPGSAETFGDLVDLMGLDDEQVRHFDYRWTTGGPDHAAAARHADVGATARSLAAYLTGLSREGRPIHLVGYSKGGSAVAEFVEGIDRGTIAAVEGVRGATLLDPPMATGIHGVAQGLGRWVGLAHDGGYDPVECSFLWWDCIDHRVGLGSASGIDVAVVRSPDAALTNFADVPEGLAVHEAPSNGRSVWSALADGPAAAISAVNDAHVAVLGDPAVAACIVGQMGGAGCDLPAVGGIPLVAPLAASPGGTMTVRTV
ncbi:MAG: hypothetical protein R3290_01890 [Acidimicrobiia bacterium]|nr:hypothetical protein [Acidimicrobiia bacterium]